MQHNSNAAREQYIYAFLNWAHDELFPSEDRPPLRIGFGQPPGTRPTRNRRILGACFKRAASSDGVNEMFLCPTEDDTMRMLVTALHEYCHAIDDNESGHRGNFVRLAKSAGMQAPWTETPPSPELQELLDWYVAEYGDIPAGHLTATARVKPKQGTRMLKASCNNCGFTVRASAKHIDAWDRAGADCPVCRNGMTFE